MRVLRECLKLEWRTRIKKMHKEKEEQQVTEEIYSVIINSFKKYLLRVCSVVGTVLNTVSNGKESKKFNN